MWHGDDMYGLIRPCARYVRRRKHGARLTWNLLKNSNLELIYIQQTQ